MMKEVYSVFIILLWNTRLSFGDRTHKFICILDWRHQLNCSHYPEEDERDINNGASLYHLDLAFNNLTNLSDGNPLGQNLLKDIQTQGDIMSLNLSNNALSTLEHFTFPETLIVLDISHNYLVTVKSESFVILDRLLVLNLSYNHMTVLNGGLLVGMFNLVQFNVSWNRIHTIEPDAFNRHLRRLTSVDVSHNELLELGPWPFQIQGQVYFNLSHNHMTRLQKSPLWENHLTVNTAYDVDLTYNNFTTWFGDDLKKYSKLGEITAYNFAQYGFNIDHNPLVCDCQIFQIATDVRNSFVGLAMPAVTCSHPGSLKGSNIFTLDPWRFVCNITEKCPLDCLCQFSPYENAMYVNCFGNGMTTFPVPLPEYSNINLDVSNNTITDLYWVPSMENITRLNISHNKIAQIDSKTLSGMTKLKVMDISYNNFQLVPETIQHLSAHSVNMTGNRLLCSCDQMWLSDWLRLDMNMTVTTDHLFCLPNARLKPKTRVRDVKRPMLNCNSDIAVKISSVLGVFLFLVIVAGAVFLKWRYQFKVLTYKLLKYHPRDNVTMDTDDSKLYDVYLSCDEDDSEVLRTVKNRILPKLEVCHEYDVFVPLRQMAVGDSRADAIVEDISSSRRFVAMVTRGYLRKGWCLYEFDQAHRLFVEDKIGKVIVVLLEEIDDEDILQEPLHTYVREKKCLKISDKMFWAKLMYELPVKDRNDRDTSRTHLLVEV